ncbi:MAG: HAMP domain-containing sensor histidine kinase, partial [Cyanobacteria bacterium J06642_11]
QKCYPHPPETIRQKLHDVELEFLKLDLAKVMSSMQTGSDRIRNIVLSLRNFSRLDESDCKIVDIHTGLDNTILILGHRLELNNNLGQVQVLTDYGQVPLVRCYPGQLNQVFMNILLNAIDALELAMQQQHEKGQDGLLPKIVISTQVIDREQVEIVISDNALGMTEAVHSQIFNPFFTTKPVGQGTGLGLAISHQVITEKHKGNLWCESTPGHGSRFIIHIPMHIDIAPSSPI